MEDRYLLSYSVTDLGTLGGTLSYAFGINASSQVVGAASIPGSAIHAFLYDATATPAMQDLGTLGGANSEANGINAFGQVVGDSQLPGNSRHAFLYDGTVTPVMLDLNDQIPSDSGWVLLNANAIIDSGQIAGYGSINGQAGYHACLLTPDGGPSAGSTAHGTPASLAAIPAPVSASFVAGASVLTTDAALVSAAALGPVLADHGPVLADHGPVLAPKPPTVPDRYVDAAPALTLNVTVTPTQRTALDPGAGQAPDGLDHFFADLGQDRRLDGRLA